MNGKKAKELRRAVRSFDAEYVAVPMPALKKMYKDMKKAYKRGKLDGS